MRAVLCKAYGPIEDLVVEDVAPLAAGPGQVVIDVKAASVNFPDVLIVQNLYQFKPEPPFSPGSEVAGVIKSVGEGVTQVKVGDRVIGSGGFGGFAEELVVEAAKAIAIPDEMPFDEAAAFMLVYGTSYHALKQRAELKPGETILVLGASGGVGLSAIEIAKAMGANVIAAASSQEKVDFCLKHGADKGLVYPRGPLSRDQQKELSNQIKELTGGLGADVIYDPVGDDYAEPALRAIAWKGRYLVIGFAAGNIPKIPLNLALLKGCQIVGVFWGMFTGVERDVNEANNQDLFELYAQGKIKPRITAHYPLEKAVEALQDMAGRKVTGKIVLTP